MTGLPGRPPTGSRLACLLLAAAGLAAGPAGAQDATPDLTGHRVRLDLSGIDAPVVGHVLSVGERSLAVRVEGSGERAEVGWADVKHLAVSRGKKGNTLKGLVGGLFAWGVLAGAVAAVDTLDESGVAEPLVIGGFLAAGALTGSRIKTEKWQHLPVPQAGHASTAEGRSACLRITIRF